MRRLIFLLAPVLILIGCDTPPPRRFSASSLTPGRTLKVEIDQTSANVRLRLPGGKYIPVDLSPNGDGRALYGVPLSASSGTLSISLVRNGLFSVFYMAPSTSVVIVAAERVTEPLHFNPEKSKLLVHGGMALESAQIHQALARSEKDHTQHWHGIFKIPVQGRVLSAFGTPRRKNSDSINDVHRGVDLSSPEKTPVLAPNDGVVILVRPFQYHGNMVLVSHGQGIGSIYLHLSSATVTEGQILKQGDQIGLVGHTGLATGPHLHWGLYVHQEPVDPIQWLEEEF